MNPENPAKYKVLVPSRNDNFQIKNTSSAFKSFDSEKNILEIIDAPHDLFYFMGAPQAQTSQDEEVTKSDTTSSQEIHVLERDPSQLYIEIEGKRIFGIQVDEKFISFNEVVFNLVFLLFFGWSPHGDI